MHVAVRTGPGSPGRFSSLILPALAREYPGDSFRIPAAAAALFPAGLSPNLTLLPAGPSWLRGLRRERQPADACLSFGLPPGRRDPPCCLLLSDTAAAGGRIRHASAVAVPSRAGKTQLLERLRIPGEKVAVLYGPAAPGSRPLSWEEQEQVRETYTGGREYLFCPVEGCSGAGLLDLLKAFSHLKKRLMSHIPLVLYGATALQDKLFREALAAFRYRKDVILQEDTQPEAGLRLTAAAYAWVYPGGGQSWEVPVADALRCGVPVLTPQESGLEEVAGAAGLYFKRGSAEEMGEQLYRIYRDEALRQRLAARAPERAELLTPAEAARSLHALLEQAAGYNRKTG
ncbi:glycosyltransferase [Compostibacter hankyongensis]|uniref:Glycosyl transferase family 1 domain-containing protein n=1 Tax=Compostibacter hankyongensis TaxID=1007089 RepID=A0ABP8FTH1_9BACT